MNRIDVNILGDLPAEPFARVFWRHAAERDEARALENTLHAAGQAFEAIAALGTYDWPWLRVAVRSAGWRLTAAAIFAGSAKVSRFMEWRS